VIKYGTDIILLGERVDALMAGRKETTDRLEDQERRLIRIETLIEISQARRREPKSKQNLVPCLPRSEMGLSFSASQRTASK
jgi:hypothetical protein